MKKYIHYLLSLLLLLVFSGCYELDRYSASEVSSGTFWQTKAQADEAIAAVYSQLQNDNVFGIAFGLDCLSDIGTGYDAAGYQTIARGTNTATNSIVSAKWSNLYEGIARAHLVMQNIGRISEDEMSTELKAQYMAEVKFLRALYYFQLLDFFGGVPIYDETVVIEENFSEMKEPRSSAEQVREFILSDLDDAIASLPVEWESEYYGRATKGAAIVLKGKVLLYNKQYSEAATLFEQVILSGKYSLYSSYENLFKPGGDESDEMIFAIQNIGGVGQDYGMPMTFYMGTRSAFGAGWDNVTAATDFVDSYEYLDGKPFDWEDWIPGFTTSATIQDATFRATLSADKKTVAKYPDAKGTLLEMYDQRDPRMQQSLILPYTWYKGWVSNAKMDCEYVVASGVNKTYGFVQVNNSWDIYLWRKFVAEYDMDGQINNRSDTPINFPLIRYADVLLMLAECYNETGKQTEAVDLINEVRTRVNMPGINSGPAWLAATTKDQVFERIKQERAVELAAEGHRFGDYKRWGLLETLNGKSEKGFTGTAYYTKVFSERDYLWPIPQTEIDQNPALTQNPGWE